MKAHTEKAFLPWTDEEIVFLIANHEDMTSQAIGSSLGRSKSSVDTRISILRRHGVMPKVVKARLRKDVTTAQMQSNKDAVRSEVLFLLDFGDYAPRWRAKVKAGLAKHYMKEDLKWFWDRREWKLSQWMEFFHA